MIFSVSDAISILGNHLAKSEFLTNAYATNTSDQEHGHKKEKQPRRKNRRIETSTATTDHHN